jgi:hypothetical protein
MAASARRIRRAHPPRASAARIHRAHPPRASTAPSGARTGGHPAHARLAGPRFFPEA